MNPIDRTMNVIKVIEGEKIRGRLRDVRIKMREISSNNAIGVFDDMVVIRKADVSDAIPLEQLKGDIARAGHPVKQAFALDADARRLFFTDKDDQNLFAEFGDATDGYRVTRIAHQASIAKEYVVDDLDPSSESKNPGESITTAHQEEESEKGPPGVIPAGSPGIKPDDDDRGYGSEENIPARSKALVKELNIFLGNKDDDTTTYLGEEEHK